MTDNQKRFIIAIMSFKVHLIGTKRSSLPHHNLKLNLKFGKEYLDANLLSMKGHRNTFWERGRSVPGKKSIIFIDHCSAGCNFK